MSYILDALRKVERERRQPEVATINLERNTTPTSPYRWGLILVVLLILVNLGWLAYNALTPRTTISDDSKTVDTANAVELPKPASVIPEFDTTVVKRQSIEEFQATKQQAEQKSAGNSPRSIADLMAHVNKPAQPAPVEPKKQQTRPVVKQQANKPELLKPKPVNNKPLQTALNSAPTRIEEKQPSTIVKSKRSRVPNTPVKKPATKAKQPPRHSKSNFRKTKKIPMLRQMSAEFREDLPRLDINVYVHADDSSNAFVIINMRKYRIGDRIGENLKLISIGVDGMTLSKNGKKFQIARP